MDAEAFVFLLIQKLENLLLEEARSRDERFKNQIQTALRNLKRLNESWKDADPDHEASMNDRRVVHLLGALYSAEAVTNALFIIKEFSNRGKGEKYGFKKISQWPLVYIKSLQSQILFRNEMKKFKNEIRALSSVPVYSVEKKEAVSNNDDVVSVATGDTFTSFQNEKDYHQRQERWERISGFCVEEETIYGALEQEIKNLVAQLVPEQYRRDYQSHKIFDMIPADQYHEQATQAIVVVGDRGSGKTTLIRTVYCREDVIRHFDERAWVDVSSKSSTRSVLIDILGQITNQGHLVMETLSEEESLLEEELKWKISKLLEETRYLIVLDDVETPKVWEALQEVLCSSTTYGSRIIITTRNKDVKNGDDPALRVTPLKVWDSWKLFSLMVQVPKDVLNSSEFIKLKKQILEIGGGLPYQILLLASLLSERRSVGAWSKTIERAYKQKFESRILDESTTNSNPSSEEEIQTVISSIQFSNQSLEDPEDHEPSSSHSMEEAPSNFNIDQDLGADSASDTTISFQNEQGQNSQQQLPERIFGLKEQITKLVGRLIPADNRDDIQSTQVIAVVGEGGSGKTTLVRTVYDSADVKRHFIRSAWINVPSEFKARDVFIDILKQIIQGKFVEVTASEGELRSSLTTLLKRTRYLIVMEDVKTTQVWETLRDAIFSSLQGGKIIVTTRNANYVPQEASSTLRVHPLNENDSWELPLNKVRKTDVLKNPELITLKKRVWKICDGLPSRIILLGGFLSTKEINPEEWSVVIDSVEKSGKNISALSYEKLDPKLKPCFLYTGLFPRTYEIPVRRLIHLWCAEGFVSVFDPNQEIDAEDLAEIYFEELVSRNMIQVTRWRLDGSPKACRMPSFLYDVFSPEAEHAGSFYHEFQSTKQPQFAVRQVEAYLGIVKDFSPILEVRHQRSYVAFNTRLQGSPDRETFMFLKSIINNRGFGLLTVLDLEGVYKPMLSDDTIGKLLLLSYLGLRSTFIDSLPSSVVKLPYLETLDVNHTKIEYLPPIWEVTKLQHLYLNWIHSDITVDQNLSKSLSNLHTLWGLSMKDGGAYIQNLTKLRKLGLTCRSESAVEGIAKSLDQLRKLQSLKLMYVDRIGDIAYLNLQKLKGLNKLQQLYLLGIRLESSVLHFLPPSLKILTLSQSELEYDPMPVLGQLPSLKILRLFGKSYRGKRIECLPGGFLQLRVLKLWKLPLKEWTVQEKAMPCLRELEIRSCQYLEPPSGLQNATTLKDVVLTNMPSSFRAAVEGSLSKNVYIKIITRRSSPLPE